MMSSTGSEEETHYNSSSWSSSTTATPRSPFSQATPRTMEEVWKDINLSSLPNPSNSSNFRNLTLQDFLARPFANVAVSPSPDHHHSHVTLNSPPPPPPATVLSLNHSDSDQFQLFCIDNLNTRPFVNLNHPSATLSADKSFTGAYAFEGLGSQLSSSSSGLVMPSVFGFEKKRQPESDRNFGGDQRHKRMIKNRESAARSRARKQAYTNQMEITVKHLMEENARLRKQNEQLTNAAAAQLPKQQQKLGRSTTAPF